MKKKSKTLLHFGAVDWQTHVYLNTQYLGNHTGGYDGFSFEVTDLLMKNGNTNELIIYVFDPSDDGAQPNGKQRISAIDNPGGDQYTPNSGIWQTVWLETVPDIYIDNISINADTQELKVSANLINSDTDTINVSFDVYDGGHVLQEVKLCLELLQRFKYQVQKRGVQIIRTCMTLLLHYQLVIR